MPSLLDMLGYAGNLLDLPGSSVRDLLSGNNPFDQWATPFSSDNRATGRDVLRPFLGDNEETGMSGWISNPMEGVKDIAGFWLEMVADPLNFVSLSPLWRALKGRKAVKGANAAQEAANAGRYGYVNPKLLADDMLGGADDAGGVLDEVANPMVEQAGPKLLGYTPAPESWRYPGREVGHHGGWDWSASATPEHPYGMMDLSRIHTGEGNTVKGPGGYIADDIATTPRYKQFAQNKMDDAYRNDLDTLEKYFTPGRVVQGYSGPDKVLQFTKDDPRYVGSWDVMVQRVDDLGNPVPGEPPRSHATAPDLRQIEKILGPGPRAKTYTLDMPAGTKGRMMNWEGDFYDQPQAVQDLMQSHPTSKVLDELDNLEQQAFTITEQMDRVKKKYGINSYTPTPNDPAELVALREKLTAANSLVKAKEAEAVTMFGSEYRFEQASQGISNGEKMADLLMGQHPAYAGFEDVTGLKEAGVPGMKNLAGSTGKASYNYAIWDQDLINQMRVRAIDGQEVPINPMFGPVKAEQRVIPQIADSPLTEVINPMSPQPLPGLAKPAMQGAAYQALARFNSYGGSL